MTKREEEISSTPLGYHAKSTKSISFKTHIQEIISMLVTIVSLLFIDLVGITLALLSSFMIRIHILTLFSTMFISSMPARIFDNVWWVVCIWIFCLAYEGLYIKRLSFWRETKMVVKATVVALLFTLSIIALTKSSDEFSRTTLMMAFILALVWLPLGRYWGKYLLAKIGLWNQPVLILGAGLTGTMIASSLCDEPYIGYKVFGFLEDDPAKKKKGVNINGVNYCILGGFEDAEKIICDNKIKNVILATPGTPGRDLVNLTNRLKAYTHSILVVPDFIGMSVAGGQVEYLSNDQIVAYSTRNNLANPVNIITKRLFDIVVGIILLICLLPVLAIITVAIKLDSPGPLGFAHKRVGHKGHCFNCYKFRSMVNNAQSVLQGLLEKDPALREEWERDFKLKDDPRVTRVGKILRKTSLDELPQIFNVLKGDMSLVGPRPIVSDEIAKFDEYIKEYFMVLPGITGLWGVSGRNDIEYEERVQMETWYVRNWSMWLDITLLFRTVGVVLGKKGAY